MEWGINMDMLLFSKRLKDARETAKLKQSELAKKSGVTSATISAYENIKNGKTTNPSLENICKLAGTLNVSLDWLCGMEEKKHINEDNSVLLNSIMSIFNTFDSQACEDTIFNYSTSVREECYLLKIVITYDLYDFLNEYQKIKALEDTKDLVTAEMIKTLKNSLIEKYKNKLITPNQVQNAQKNNNFVVKSPDTDLPC